MAIDPQFRTVGSFDAETPLDRQLDDLESNVGAALKDLATKSETKLKPTNRKQNDYTAQAGELVIATNGIDVRLPSATARNAAETVGIIVESGTVTVLCAESDVHGGTSDSITTGSWFYISTGVGWWRQG